MALSFVIRRFQPVWTLEGDVITNDLDYPHLQHHFHGKHISNAAFCIYHSEFMQAHPQTIFNEIGVTVYRMKNCSLNSFRDNVLYTV